MASVLLLDLPTAGRSHPCQPAYSGGPRGVGLELPPASGNADALLEADSWGLRWSGSLTASLLDGILRRAQHSDIRFHHPGGNMHPVETYLREIAVIRHSGAAVPETSYYPALKRLLDEVGGTLRPKVTCIVHLRSQGAGIPDGGLFTADQLRRVPGDPFGAQLPARAVIEVKGTSASVDQVIGTEQVARYLERYGLVLVTNLRDFALVSQGRMGKPVKLEAYHLAPDEASFWADAVHPRRLVERHGDGLVEYLKRAMLANAPLRRPQDVAWFLASYARDALARVEHADVPALERVRLALEDALGLTFRGEKGNHFFKSTLVQTLFYGIFSAWVLWHDEDRDRTDSFDWRTSAFHLQLPVIEGLFEQLGDPSKLRALNLMDVLDWAGATLNRVDRPAFFAAFEHRHAVQYFYEPFLEAFDPELRKELGVWYTPIEVVQYMVARVDTVLREALGIAGGLADPRVVVIDLCAGTAAYLVEVLRRVATTLESAGEGALVGRSVKKAAIERVFGFEILPAPYVIAHLQLGLLLRGLGAPLNEGERLGMFLTNALTGWERDGVRETRALPGFPELEAERDAAAHVKKSAKIIVVLGNPPYNGFAGVSPAEEMGLVDVYKQGLVTEWGIKKFNLDDLYVRFLRLAERSITEHSGQGIVCYISNFSYLSDPSFVVMRRRFLAEFDELWFDCMNGDSRETGKLTPEGRPDPSVFSTESNREGIRVGTTIALMVRTTDRSTEPTVRFRHFWGATKRSDLVSSLECTGTEFCGQYATAMPAASNRYSFRPEDVASEYLTWPLLPALALAPPFAGIAEDRGKALISVDRQTLARRMRMYFDSGIDWPTICALGTGLSVDVPRFDAKAARDRMLGAEQFDESRLVRFSMRPYDVQWCYYSPLRPLWREPRPDYWRGFKIGSPALVSRRKAAKTPEGPPIAFSRWLCDYHMMPPNASIFPVFVGRGASSGQLALMDMPAMRANLSNAVLDYLGSLGVTDAENHVENAALIWMHALAICYSGVYLGENVDGIRQDWPRIPMPADRDALLASAALGQQVAALLDIEAPVEGVTSGVIRPELRAIGVVSQTTPGALDLAVTAGWGHSAQGSVTMPGKGKAVQRTPAAEECPPALGESTMDVYLNDRTYWRNIPTRVWRYTIGGYQVIKKWLSYREEKLLGRVLLDDEAREVRDMARRIAALLLLEPDLDVNYTAVKSNAYRWPGQ